MSEPCMVCITFRGIEKDKVVAHFKKAGVPLYELPDPYPDMIVLKKYVFDDHPEGHLKFLFKQLGVWDYSFTAWKMAAWEENNGPVKDDPPTSKATKLLVDAGALQMVLNVLQRDADRGHSARGEMIVEVNNHTEPAPPELDVFFESMPESNGKRNWTVLLHRKGEKGFDMFEDGITIERTEYYDRARYEYDRMRYLLGQIAERPCITDYDPEILEKPIES